MKIFILPVDELAQPSRQPFRYPKYNDDYGIEQDFLHYLESNVELLSTSASSADWHYLPVFWTRFHLNRNRRPRGLAELQEAVDLALLDTRRTFSVCQFDDGPLVELGHTTVLLGSRKHPQTPGIDVPLLASPIPNAPTTLERPRHLASFVGQYKNHPVRHELAAALRDRDDVYLRDGDFGIEEFVSVVRQSAIGLTPRGYGGSSFRLFEVMQLGRVPLVIGDVDPRPFRRHLMWDEMSFYVSEVDQVAAVLDEASGRDLVAMGAKARQMWEALSYGRWCRYALLELAAL